MSLFPNTLPIGKIAGTAYDSYTVPFSKLFRPLFLLRCKNTSWMSSTQILEDDMFIVFSFNLPHKRQSERFPRHIPINRDGTVEIAGLFGFVIDR